MARISKTLYRYDERRGFIIVKTLSRSFDTIEEARRFAEGKQVTDIYRFKGRFRVEWKKTIDNND